MKKVVRMLGLCALVALAFTSCKKEENKTVTFTATINQPTTNVRTHAMGLNNDYFLVWDNGDEIMVIDNTDGANENFKLTSFTNETATFKVVGDKVAFFDNFANKDYTAFYPLATINADDEVEIVLNETQTYRALHSFWKNTYPMCGHETVITNAEGEPELNFDFTSDCGFLYFTFQAPEGETREFDHLTLTANDPTDYLNGTLVYDQEGNFQRLIPGTNVIEMNCEAKVIVTGDLLRDVTIILPAGALQSGFTVELFNNGECVFSKAAQPIANTIVPMQYTEMMSMVIE